MNNSLRWVAILAKRLKIAIPAEKLQEFRAGSETKIGTVTVKADNSNHPPAATPISFVITSEDGIKLFHTSDSLPFPEMTAVGEKEKLDVVFCTVGIAPGTSPETGLDIARLTKPKVAVPYHTNSISEQKRFGEILKAQMPRVACLIPEQKQDLPSIKKEVT
jgi:L-ascorbate metabolism protein UlaG (beta-lactamase superfamily)